MARTDVHARSVGLKRKPPLTTTTSDVSSSKRQRRHDPMAVTCPPLSTLSTSRARPLQATPRAATGRARTTCTPPRCVLQTPTKQQNVETVEPMALFSRYADPSVPNRQRCPVDWADVSCVSAYNPTGATLLEKPLRARRRHHREHETEGPSAVLPRTSNGGEDGVVDLTAVAQVERLEVVEGDDILQTLLRASTPRIKRRFPSEEALTESEQRDRDALRRRRLKLRSQFSVLTEEQAWDDGRVQPTGLGDFSQCPEVERCLVKPEERGRVKSKGETVEEATDDERAHLVEDEAETDEETTESKINRLSQVMHMNWRQFVLWLVAGALLLCAMVVAAPFVKKLMESPLPYCDSEWIEVDEGSFVLAGPADSFDRSKALQPFITAASVATRTSESVCQPCPVYGNCLNGSVISCAPPYELQYGLCKENPEVQANLDQLALSIQKFIVEKAKKSCDNVSLWSYLNSNNGVESASGVVASIEVWLSDVQTFVTETNLFGKAVSNLPREYVFNRALDMALRDLKDIYVTEDQSQLVVGGNVVPWSCRAKHQLYAHMKLIALAVALGTVLVFAYRQFLLYRTERQLVDRFVKEVRFFLLDRTRRLDRSYPADHLRDDLFEKQSLQDRKWLCKSVWPKVAAVVKDDSRIKIRVMRVRGEEMIVWEWASSSSPSYRRAASNRGWDLRTVPTPQQRSVGDARPVSSRRRKKDSRMSLPW